MLARFDAGRVTPEGREESFTAAAKVPKGGSVVLRVDESPCELVVELEPSAAAGERERWTVIPTREGAESGASSRESWSTMRVVLPRTIEVGDRVHIRVPHGWLHDFHVWLVGGSPLQGKP